VHPPLAPEHIDAAHRAAALGDLELESGEKIVDYQQSYVTHGELDNERSNAIVVCASLTGTMGILDHGTRRLVADPRGRLLAVGGPRAAQLLGDASE